MAESYNPFKMWGSYVGAIWGILSYYLIWGIPRIMEKFGENLLTIIITLPEWVVRKTFFSLFFNGCEKLRFELSSLVLGTCWYRLWLPTIIIGFLIGWGIHSLIRKLT